MADCPPSRHRSSQTYSLYHKLFHNLGRNNHENSQDDEEDFMVTNLMPVAYTAPVKAQVLQTISLLISNAKDPTSLYYLLSNNHINLLLCSLLPLKQFTTASQEEIIPVFVGLLKNLTIHLAQSPSTLSQFFSLPKRNTKKMTFPNPRQHTKKTHTMNKSSFPLLSAAVEVATSAYARSDSFVRLTALNIINNICGLLDEFLHGLIDECVVEQQLLFTNLCQCLVEQYQNLVTAVLKLIQHLQCHLQLHFPSRKIPTLRLLPLLLLKF